MFFGDDAISGISKHFEWYSNRFGLDLLIMAGSWNGCTLGNLEGSELKDYQVTEHKTVLWNEARYCFKAFPALSQLSLSVIHQFRV